MSSSFQAFLRIASRFPGDLPAALRLARLLAPSDQRREFTLGLIQSTVRAQSLMRLSRMMTDLASSGVVARRIRVNSRQGGGVQKFSDLSEIPDSMYDPFTDTEWTIGPEDIEVVFEVDKA